MKTYNLVKQLYMGLTVFLILSVNATTMRLYDILPALVFMWITFICFRMGSRGLVPAIGCTNSSKFLFERKKLLVAMVAITFSVLVTKFYTGLTPVSVVLNVLHGNSLYFSYQKYHSMNNIGDFSLAKLPFILMNFTLSLILVYSYVSLLIIKNKLTIPEKIYLTTIAISYLFFGIARGTNFEVFQFTVLIVFVIYNRMSPRRTISELKVKAASIVIGTISVYAFSLILSGRGSVGYYITSEIKYDQTAVFSLLFPGFSLLISKLTMYFGFGFYYVSAFFNRIWLTNINTFLAAFLPCGLRLLGVENLKKEINTIIDPGTNWRPDIVDAIDIYGLIGALIITYFLGRILRANNHKNKDAVAIMADYLVVLQMFSFPIGNFIMISSANKLLALFVAALLFTKNILKRLKWSVPKY